jgi:urease accessory protein UreF
VDSQQTRLAPRDTVEMLGELHPLIAQLGSADGLVSLRALSASLRTPQVASLTALTAFLRAYRSRVLLAMELPAIARAFHHASRQEVRELIALDQALARQGGVAPMAAASRRVGRSQLQRLRPLRDQRVVRRYLQAVEAGQAHGWHTLVYGLTLAVYSLPVRQGLMSYARHTLRGFIQVSARPLGLTRADCQGLLEELCAGLPGPLERVLPAGLE